MCVPNPRGPCANFQLGLWISANSVVNITTAKSLQNSRKQFASRRKRSSTLDPGSCLGYTSMLDTSIVPFSVPPLLSIFGILPNWNFLSSKD